MAYLKFKNELGYQIAKEIVLKCGDKSKQRDNLLELKDIFLNKVPLMNYYDSYVLKTLLEIYGWDKNLISVSFGIFLQKLFLVNYRSHNAFLTVYTSYGVKRFEIKSKNDLGIVYEYLSNAFLKFVELDGKAKSTGDSVELQRYVSDFKVSLILVPRTYTIAGDEWFLTTLCDFLELTEKQYFFIYKDYSSSLRVKTNNDISLNNGYVKDVISWGYYYGMYELRKTNHIVIPFYASYFKMVKDLKDYLGSVKGLSDIKIKIAWVSEEEVRYSIYSPEDTSSPEKVMKSFMGYLLSNPFSKHDYIGYEDVLEIKIISKGGR